MFLQTLDSYFVSDKTGGIKVYLFGSACYATNPNDIDIIIIYDKSIWHIDGIIKIRNKILASLNGQLGLPIDICLLSKEEAENNNFIQEEKAILILNYDIFCNGPKKSQIDNICTM